MGAIFALDEKRVAEEHGKDKSRGHEDDEGDIGAIVDLASLVVDILAKRNERANDSAQVEDHPEPGNEASFLVLKRVGHHHGTLCAPEQTSAGTQQTTGED